MEPPSYRLRSVAYTLPFTFLLAAVCLLYLLRAGPPLPLPPNRGLWSDVSMDVLSKNGIAVNVPKNEFLSSLSALSVAKLKAIRNSLFTSAKSEKLTLEQAVLVNRRDTASKPITTKLCKDIWTLTDCLRHCKEVPRVLLRNGKRDLSTFEASQSETVTEPEDSAGLTPSDTHTPPPKRTCDRSSHSELPPRGNFAISTVMKEINTLKNEFQDLKSTLCTLSRDQSSENALRHEVANLRCMVSKMVSD